MPSIMASLSIIFIEGIDGSLAESLPLDLRAYSGGESITASVRCRVCAVAVEAAAWPSPDDIPQKRNDSGPASKNVPAAP